MTIPVVHRFEENPFDFQSIQNAVFEHTFCHYIESIDHETILSMPDS